MKLQSTLGYWGAAILSIACSGSESGGQLMSMADRSAAIGGAGSGGMSPLGAAGSGGSTAGAPTQPMPTAGSAGAVATAGQGGGAGGLGTAGGSGAGAGGVAGAVGAGGAQGFGIHTCQPALQAACMPPVEVHIADAMLAKPFTDALPDLETTMQEVACIACSMLYRSPDEIPQELRHPKIDLYIEDTGGILAYAVAQERFIAVDQYYVQYFAEGSTPQEEAVEFRGVLQHEVVHLYQNYGEFYTGEGMADWVRLRVGLYPPGRCQPGGTLMDGYTTTGCFLSWLTGPSVYHSNSHPALDLELGYEINTVLGEQGEPGLSVLLMEKFGADVDTLWNQYQNDLP